LSWKSSPNNKKNSTNDTSTSKRGGSLTIVGSGIQAVRQFTLESRQAVEQADKVLFVIPDLISEIWIKKINSNSESLGYCYTEGKPRLDIYREMTERTLKYVREGLNVCVVYYGHPGVFVTPSHESIKQARAEGFDARMLPGVSAEDCLFADLGVDPSTHGCQSFEATDFLLHKRKFDSSSHLILWQIGVIGTFVYNAAQDNKAGLTALVDFLEKYYSSDHEVFVYQASEYSICKPLIQRLLLSKLSDKAYVDDLSTLYIPPKMSEPIDYKMAEKLGLSQQLNPVGFQFSIKRLFRIRSDKNT
jgi:uncharacterized protein YabN with tetrapyrrole methylase and pyrophosphatase domain